MADDKVSLSVALRLAQDALAKGLAQDVVKQCKVILKQDRNNYDGYVLLGSALLQSKQYAQAEKALRLAVGVNSSKLAAWQRLVEVYEATDNGSSLVEACEEARERAQMQGKPERFTEYTRKLAIAHATNLDYKKACEVWQELMDSSSTSESLHFQSLCGYTEAKVSLLKQVVQKEYHRRLALGGGTSSSSKVYPVDGSTPTIEDADVLLQLEDEMVERQESKEVAELLQRTTAKAGPHLEHHHELLLHLLLCRVRATRSSEGEAWQSAKLQVLQQCFNIVDTSMNVNAFDVAFRLLEDDDSDYLSKNVNVAPKRFSNFREQPLVCVGRHLAHTYIWHGNALAALACVMHLNECYNSSLERKRIICERALRLDESLVTGWQILAEVHVEQKSFSSAAECVRRGLQALSRSRAKYGVGLRVAETKFQLTLGQTYLASQEFSLAEDAFNRVSEDARKTPYKHGDLLLAAAYEGLAKVALAQGEVELARSRLDMVLALNPNSHWALSEQGQLAHQEDDREKALWFLQQAIALQPSIAIYHLRLGILYWKAGGSVAEVKEKVLPHLMEAVKLDPLNSSAFRFLGHCYVDLVGDTQRAIRCYQRAVALNLEDADSGEALCDLLDRTGEDELEEDICKGASNKSRRAFWAWRRLGLLQVLHKEWSEAVPNLQHALRGYVTDCDLWEALGLAYQHLGMLTAALKAYGRAVSLGQSPSVFALMQSGNILLLLGSFGKAGEMFREALKYVPVHVGALCGLGAAMLGRARHCMSIAAFAWGATLAKEALELLQVSVPVCSSVGAFWKLLGDLEVVHAQALPCKELDTVVPFEDSQALRVAAVKSVIDSWFIARLDSLKRAKVFYQRALHLSPSKSSIYSDLGVTLELIWSLEHDRASVVRCCHDSPSVVLKAKRPYHCIFDLRAASPALTIICGGLRVEGDNPNLWVTLGMISKHKGLRQHCFIRALLVDGNHALAWGSLGQLYLTEEEESLAREAFDRARSANPALAVPWAGMGLVHSLKENAKDLQEAFASCLYAVQLSPTTKIQLGLGRLAALTEQLQAVEVYTALQQAVNHAPHKAESYNLKGLSCESRGDYEGAVKAYYVARDLLALSGMPAGSPSIENLAVCTNLARALCKASRCASAVQEYELLGKWGLFRENSGVLRGYAVSLWRGGHSDMALHMARKSMEVEMDERSVRAGQSLAVKLINANLGSVAALAELRAASSDMFRDLKYCLSALALIVVSGDEQQFNLLLSSCGEVLEQGGVSRVQRLAAVAKQLAGDRKAALQILQKALHSCPQSIVLRTRMGNMLLDVSSGQKAKQVTRCCRLGQNVANSSAHYGALCSALSRAACACSSCGQLDCCGFSSCKEQQLSPSILIRQLQRWVHTEPWNVNAHYHLVLCTMQKARAQNFPVDVCHAVLRVAITTVSLMEDDESNEDRNFHKYMLAVLLAIILHTAQRIFPKMEGPHLSEAVSKLKKFSLTSSTAALQLARFYACTEDYSSMLSELNRTRRFLRVDDCPGWFALFELQQQYKLQDADSSLEACKKAVAGRSLDEQREWMGLLHSVRVKALLSANDITTAHKAVSEAVQLSPENPVLHLVHGALTSVLVSNGTNPDLVSSAVRSLSKAMNLAAPGCLPFACIMLCQLQSAVASRNSDISKWERKLWVEWDAWPAESRPAELYYQMGLLAQKTQGTLVGMAGTTETSWTVRAWMQRAVHLNPGSLMYWSHLGYQ